MYEINTIKRNLDYFKDTLCTKVYLKNEIIFSCIKTGINSIENYNIYPHIISSKILKDSSVPNSLVTSSGNKILVSGYIFNTLFYNTFSPCKSICSTNFEIPFKAYINLNNNLSSNVSKYITKATIKNICLTQINSNSICESLDLFIYACPVKPAPPPIKKLQNAIIINSINNNEVAKIEFDTKSQKFIVEITDEIPNLRKGTQEYFVISLRNVNTQRIILRTQIIANRTANIFSLELNNFNFSFNDNFLQLDYLYPSKVIITNFPQININHIPINKREFYRITSEGLLKYIPTVEL